MRLRLVWVAVVLSIVPVAFAKDVYLSIGGSVGSFFTDARIFNPSQTRDIQIQAYFLPVGNGDNSAVQPTTITVPKRSQVVYDNVVSSLFHASGLGAIRLTSADDFVATQRIYASVAGDTLGQFVGGVDNTAALRNGVVIQLKANGGGGQHGTFRTNVGAVNPNNVAATITWRVYDKTNAVIGSPHQMTMPPFAVVGPTGMTAFGENIPGTADLSDAWVGFVSDQPIIAYGSVVDNGSTDPTYVPASNDSDPPSASSPTAKVILVSLSSFQIAMSPQPTGLKVGDHVTFKVSANVAGLHGFRLTVPDGSADLVQDRGPYPAGQTFTYDVTIPMEGTYFYTCTNPICGTGHDSMAGTFDVGQGTGNGNPKY
jgi:heme/copper-type cytochrome/quinol oxidase subunit 2